MNISYSPDTAVAYEESTSVNEASTAAEIAPTIDKPEQDENPWGVWPYVWFVDLHVFCRDRFHSFHGRVQSMRLARANRRRQQQFWSQPGFGPSEEELELRLL